LEATLAENKEAQEKLRLQLDEANKKLQALQQSSDAQQTGLEAEIRGLQAAKSEVDRELKRLSDELAEQTRARTGAEQQVGESGRQRTQLEAALAESKETHAKLRLQLDEAHRQLQADQQSSATQRAALEDRIRSLLEAKSDVDLQLQRLTDKLAREARSREEAAQQAAEITRHRTELKDALAESKQLQEKLRLELDAADKQLRAQQQSSAAEHSKLQGQVRELQSAKSEVEQQLKRLSEELVQEAGARTEAERKATEIAQQRGALEIALAENKLAQVTLRQQLETATRGLEQHRVNSGAEQIRLEQSIKQLGASKAVLEQDVQQLTKALAEQTRHRESAEQQATKTEQHRAALEAELAQKAQAQTQTHQELQKLQKDFAAEHEKFLAEQARLEIRTKELHSLNTELAAVRSSLKEEGSQRQKLANTISELERAKAELTAEVAAATARIQSHENAIQLRDLQLRERQEQIDRLETSLQSESAQRRDAESRIETLEKELTELTARMAEKVAEQQRLQQREAELQHQIRRQTAELAQSSAAAASQQIELNRLSTRIADLEIVESALCARVRDITAQNETACRRIHELENQTEAANQTIDSRDREIAGLRYAILESTRVGSKFSRERLASETLMLDGWKRLLSSLLDTPLSRAQRGLVTEISSAIDGWKNTRQANPPGTDFLVDPFQNHYSKFNCAEMVEDALAAVRENAQQSSLTVRATLVGSPPQAVCGNPDHICQLITTLAASLQDFARPGSIELQLSFEPPKNGSGQMLISFLLSSENDNDLAARLTALTDGADCRPRLHSSDSELRLTSAWQLALALGADPCIATLPEHGVTVLISIPLDTTSSLTPGVMNTACETNMT
jgi:chromosome segregation ATPase